MTGFTKNCISRLQNRLRVLLNLHSAHIAKKEMLCIANKAAISILKIHPPAYFRDHCFNFLLTFLLADELSLL